MVSHVRYASEKVYYYFLILVVESGVCELVNDVSESTCINI